MIASTALNLAYLKPIIVVALASATYQLIFGSFTEVPADLYAHLERYQTALVALNENSLGTALTWTALLLQKSGVFYYLLASVHYLTPIPSQELVSIVDFTNRTLFLLAVFCFARLVFANSKYVLIVASASTMFVALHMGINVFAYVRYYTLAPGMLALILYMAAISIFIKTLKQTAIFDNAISYCLIGLFGVAAAAIHTQEAMFIGVMIATMSITASLGVIYPQAFKGEINARQALTICALCLGIFASLYIYSVLNLSRAPNAHWRLWEFAPSYGFLPSITTLNLKFQFIRVVTLWGVFVYLLFFLHIKRYQNNIFILAGMLSPIVTILNPFFIDLFLRHYNSTTVWRLCYLMPIHFVAADLFVHYARQLKDEALIHKLKSALVVLGLIIFLLPIKNTWQGVHFSRFATLASADTKLTSEHYSDLHTFLESLTHRYPVLTDPMTGYMISAMTKHVNSRKKFFRHAGFKHFTFPDYTNLPLRRYKNHLLIINKRGKTQSDVGRLSQHWPAKEWQNIERYYPPHLIKHVENNPDLFEHLWANNGVQVYRLR